MIENLPTSKEFESISKECLTQAFNLLFKVYYEFTDLEEVNGTYEDVDINKVWEHNSGTLRTSLILLGQGVETFMKGTICKTSPLLLIEKKRSEWPTLPAATNKNFDDLYTISGESLLTTFCAIDSKIIIDQNLIDLIEEIRHRRNQAIHGASKFVLTANYLTEKILQTYTVFYGKGTWFTDMWGFNHDHPLFGYYDYEYEDAVSYSYLDFAKAMLGKKQLNKYLKISILGREYFCPTCKYSIERDFGTLSSKWAFLAPNSPISNVAKCVNCETESQVIRKDCITKNCKGNVIYDDSDHGVEVCLSCYEVQEE